MTDDTPAGPGRIVRAAVGAVLALLLVAGVTEVEAWPLTAWRLFSLSRGDAQTHWVLDAVTPAGEERVVDLEELPLPYRNAEWPLAGLRRASDERRDEVCQALLAAVVDRHPGTVGLRIVRDRQSQVREDGAWVVAHDREPFHECRVGEG